jgi:lysophospholipase L1-like esterase
LLAERRQDAESEGSIERAEGRMPEASVRRDGRGNPEHIGRCLIAAGLALWFALPAAAAEPVTPRSAVAGAQRVLVLGDSITHAGGWVADLAAWMESQGLDAEVINCGLPSETVSGLSEDGHAGGKFPRPDLHERLERVLRLVRPNVVLACYGMNCGIYLPLDEERFAKFKDGMERLHAAAEKAGATIIHLTPPLYGGPPGKPGPAGPVDYDAVLTAYSEWLVSKRADGWLVIDVHGPMKRALEERRKKDPTFSFAGDAVHPGDEGHWEIARAAIAGLGDEAAAANPDLPEVLGAFLPDVTKRMHLLRDAYLAAAGHLRPGMKPGLPLPEAEAQAALITASLHDRRLQLRGRKHQSGEWRIPIEWPRPKVVPPGPAPAGPAPVPADAILLFDGSTMDAWNNAGTWKVADGVVTVGQGMIESKQGFGDCQLHLEFRMPAPATGKGQGRGNSGVFLMGQYEIQVLDSFEDGTDGPLTYPDGQCGALYKQQPPAVNACRAPGEWQTYDILFTRPRFTAAGLVAKPGRVSVVHNGVAIHADTVIKGPTAWHEPPAYKPHLDALPIRIQDHGNPVQFRNIWVRPIEPVVPAATTP